MKLTIIQTGEVPVSLRDQFDLYGKMFEIMFDKTGQGFSYETLNIAAGTPFPDPAILEGMVITGSAAGVYDDLAWLEPLRGFIRQSYTQRRPMLGVCFGRHLYEAKQRPDFMGRAPDQLAVACSHQDHVITPPRDATVILASDFTPNAGLAYRNEAALSFQPHPEFADDYTVALAELRRGKAPETLVDKAVASVAAPSDSAAVAGYIGRFFTAR